MGLLSLLFLPPSLAAPLPELVASPARTGMQSPHDAAVVIGVEDYFALPDVPFAARDADAFQSFLIYSRGVPADRVQVLHSTPGGHKATREQMVAALLRAGADGAKGTVWVFFAGHGAADPGNPNERLILGDDARNEIDSFGARGLTLSDVRRMASTGGGQVVLVLDACFSGRGRSGDELLPHTRWAVPAPRIEGSLGVEWDAASPGETTGPLASVSHGAFTYFATGALRGWADGEVDGRPDGRVTSEEAQAYVSRMLKVAGVRNQVPLLIGGKGLVLTEGKLEVGPSTDAILAALAPTVETPAQAAARARRETELSARAAALQREASKAWRLVTPGLTANDAEAIHSVRAFLSRYDGAMVEVEGERRSVSLAEVAQAKTWLARTLEWVRIPGGTYNMGSSAGDLDEQPLHPVTLSAFQMTRTEVTFDQYQACVDAGVCAPPHLDDGTCRVFDGVSWSRGTLPASLRAGNQPVVCVDWSQAASFARWAGGHLPTEAQWEYAARSGGLDQPQPWGTQASSCERVVLEEDGRGCGRASTWPVCSHVEGNTAHGLCDMMGNVWEWTGDWHGTYSVEPATDPAGPEAGTRRVYRGGSWASPAGRVRAANRDGGDPADCVDYLGFRVVK